MIDLEYTEIDGLLYPNIQLDDAEAYDDLGKYGNLRLTYLHKQKPQTYRELFFTGKLAQHCAEVEQIAFEMTEWWRAAPRVYERRNARLKFIKSQSGMCIAIPLCFGAMKYY